MSEQEQHAIAGKMMAEYVQARRDLVLLAYMASKRSAAIKAVLGQLEFPTDPDSIGDLNGKCWLESLEKYPTKEEIAEIGEKITAALDAKRRLGQGLRGFGFEPKD